MGCEDVGYIGMAQEMSQFASMKTVTKVLSSLKAGNSFLAYQVIMFSRTEVVSYSKNGLFQLSFMHETL
jgi:hypothetical protein